MCPPGYHHNGIMAARELGHTMYGIYIYHQWYSINNAVVVVAVVVAATLLVGEGREVQVIPSYTAPGRPRDALAIHPPDRNR